MIPEAKLHQGQPLYMQGAPLESAVGAMVMIHGRGAAPADILTLVDEFDAPDLAYLAPQSVGGAWYPYPFMAPIASNEPWLSSTLAVVADVLGHVAEAGIPAERTLLLGFSQGACVALEFAARNPRLYGGVIGLSGGLIENGDKLRDYSGSLEGTPVFLGCSDVDPHIPRQRVGRSAEVLRRLDGDVTLRLYRGMGHTVNPDEIEFIKGMIERVRALRGPKQD
jgi:predicted esterase